jgi:hypothetical protein
VLVDDALGGVYLGVPRNRNVLSVGRAAAGAEGVDDDVERAAASTGTPVSLGSTRPTAQ